MYFTIFLTIWKPYANKLLLIHILVFPEWDGRSHNANSWLASRSGTMHCLGTSVTSGLPTIDYYLSSQLMEPENAQAHYSEKLILHQTLAFLTLSHLLATNKDTLRFSTTGRHYLFLLPSPF